MHSGLSNVFLTILEDLCPSSWVPTSLYVQPNIFMKGIKKKDSPIGGHGNGNVEKVDDSEWNGEKKIT
jgi:hypothetical protein